MIRYNFFATRRSITIQATSSVLHVEAMLAFGFDETTATIVTLF